VRIRKEKGYKMKNTKALIILCLILFLTAIGCSDYMEFAEREYQAEREAMKEEGFLFFPGEDEMQEVDPYKDNPIINEGVKSNQENEQGYSPMKENEYPEITEQDLEKSTKESEIPEERRDSYWKRLQEFRQNN
jgi:hypothetical protein